MIHERYLQLARDAASAGDRVLSENYLQHADHYYRLWRSIQPAAPPPQALNDRFDDVDGEEDVGGEAEAAEEGAAAEAGEQPDVDFPQGERPQFGEGGEGRRRRGRRNRYRPNEGENGEGREPREAQDNAERESGEAREERRERRERQPREQREENAGPEGFSSGPKPAFLRD